MALQPLSVLQTIQVPKLMDGMSTGSILIVIVIVVDGMRIFLEATPTKPAT